MYRIGVVGLVAFAGSLLGSSRPEGRCDKHLNKFSAPKDSILERVKTVAVTPLTIQGDMSDPARQRGRTALEPAVESELRSAGFAVVPATVLDSVWLHLVDSIGTLYDPKTGAPDTVRFSAARKAATQVLRERYSADAVLDIYVGVVSASFQETTASWDGTSQTYGNFGHQLLGALFGNVYRGRTRALSLIANLQSLEGQSLYEGRGGLQVYVIPDNGKFLDVPDSTFFADTARNGRSVHLAMCALVNRGRP